MSDAQRRQSQTYVWCDDLPVFFPSTQHSLARLHVLHNVLRMYRFLQYTCFLCVSLHYSVGMWAEPALYLSTWLSAVVFFVCFFFFWRCDHIFTLFTRQSWQRVTANTWAYHVTLAGQEKAWGSRCAARYLWFIFSPVSSPEWSGCAVSSRSLGSSSVQVKGTMRRGCAKAACWLSITIPPDWTRALLIPPTFSILALLSTLFFFFFFLPSCARVSQVPF